MKTLLFIFFLFFAIVSCETESGASDCYLNNTGSIKFINNDTIPMTFYVFDTNLLPLDTISVDTGKYEEIDVPVGNYLLDGVNPYDSTLKVINCSGYIYKFPPK